MEAAGSGGEEEEEEEVSGGGTRTAGVRGGTGPLAGTGSGTGTGVGIGAGAGPGPRSPGLHDRVRRLAGPGGWRPAAPAAPGGGQRPVRAEAVSPQPPAPPCPLPPPRALPPRLQHGELLAAALGGLLPPFSSVLFAFPAGGSWRSAPRPAGRCPSSTSAAKVRAPRGLGAFPRFLPPGGGWILQAGQSRPPPGGAVLALRAEGVAARNKWYQSS